MTFLSIFFYFVLTLLFFLVGSRLLIQKGKLANKLLGVQFLNLTFLIIIAYFSTPEGLLKYPFLFKISTPFVYLVFPVAYLFQEFMFYPQKKFKWYHALHFLPFILNLIEFSPIYFSSNEVKLELIKASISAKSLTVIPSNKFYVLSSNVHQIFGISQFSIYTVLLSIRLYKYLQLEKVKSMYKNKVLISWLVGDIIIKYFTIIWRSYFLLFPIENALQFNWQDILKILDYVVLVFLIFYFPNLLNGITFIGLSHSLQDGKNSNEDPQYRKIDEFFALERCYLLEDLNPQFVADKLGISSRKISFIIKRNTQLSFPDYVNHWRLQYIEEQLKTNKVWHNYTLEAFASESGFGSRSNFYNAFKKIKNQNPKDYYSAIRDNLSIKQ
jgi:AraC-like DNA-binding protein